MYPAIGERRRARRARAQLRQPTARELSLASDYEPPIAESRGATVTHEPNAVSAATSPPPSPPDLAVQRVREAGGPTDQASYACQCGYLFAAAVTTTVECPHCGTSQAW